MEDRFAVVKNVFENVIPFNKFIGMEMLEIRDGYAKARIPFREEFIGDTWRRRWHGGLLATAMDSVGGAVGVAYFSSFDDKMATIDLRVDYLKGAKAEPIIIEGELVRLGNRIMVTRMKVFNEGSDELLAEGKGVYSFYRAGTK